MKLNQTIKLSIFLVFLCALSSNLEAQVPTIADCFGAIPVCDDLYFENNSPVGAGNYESELHEDCCIEEEINSVWYIFTTKKSGNLGFEIIPNFPTDDYDWALFDLSENSCDELLDDFNMLVSCNATGGISNGDCTGVTGANGGSIYNFQNENCGTFPPTMDSDGFIQFNALVPVEAGDVYVLLLINWTGSTNGYTLDFLKGEDVEVSDNEDPIISQFDLNVDCSKDEIVLSFSELIQCSTFDENDITISGPGGPYTVSISSDNCDQQSTFELEYNLQISPPISLDGTYVFSINSDPLDLCNNPLVAFQYELIIGNQGTELAFDTTLCGENQIILDATDAEFDTYTWQDGSNDAILTVTQSGFYSVILESECITKTIEYLIAFSSIPEILNIQSTPANCNQSNGIVEILQTTSDSPTQFSLDGINYSSDLLITGLSAGDYQLFIKDEEGCLSTFEFTIGEIIQDLELELIDEIEIEFGDSVEINPLITGVYEFIFWTGDSSTLSCINCENPIATPLFNTTYTVHLTDDFGCQVSESILIRVKGEYDLYLPNIFSPNDDGLNDYFRIYGGKRVRNFIEFSVYDRWGEQVYLEENVTDSEFRGWNGRFKDRQVAPGVYAWKAQIEFVDGVEKNVFGSITLVQ